MMRLLSGIDTMESSAVLIEEARIRLVEASAQLRAGGEAGLANNLAGPLKVIKDILMELRERLGATPPAEVYVSDDYPAWGYDD